MDSLILEFNNLSFFAVGYADYIAISIKGKHLLTTTEVAEQALVKTELWCIRNCFSVNPSTTGMVLFTNKRNYSFFFNLRLFGCNLILVVACGRCGLVFKTRLLCLVFFEAGERLPVT